MSLSQGAKHRNGGFPEVSVLYNLTASLPQPEKSGLINSREFKMVRVCFKGQRLYIYVCVCVCVCVCVSVCIYLLTPEQNGFELCGSTKTDIFSIENAIALCDYGWLNLWMWMLRYKYMEWIRRADSNSYMRSFTAQKVSVPNPPVVQCSTVYMISFV